MLSQAARSVIAALVQPDAKDVFADESVWDEIRAEFPAEIAPPVLDEAPDVEDGTPYQMERE